MSSPPGGYTMGGLGGEMVSPPQLWRMVRSSWPISEAKPRSAYRCRGPS